MRNSSETLTALSRNLSLFPPRLSSSAVAGKMMPPIPCPTGRDALLLRGVLLGPPALRPIRHAQFRRVGLLLRSRFRPSAGAHLWKGTSDPPTLPPLPTAPHPTPTPPHLHPRGWSRRLRRPTWWTKSVPARGRRGFECQAGSRAWAGPGKEIVSFRRQADRWFFLSSSGDEVLRERLAVVQCRSI